MKIAGIRITIKRWDFSDARRASELHIRVETSDGQEHNLVEVVPDNELVSMFDYIWERAGGHLKAHLDKYAAQSHMQATEEHRA